MFTYIGKYICMLLTCLRRGSRTNERSIQYGEDLDVSDVTDYLSIPLDSSRTSSLSSVYCTGNYYVGSGQKLVSLEL